MIKVEGITIEYLNPLFRNISFILGNYEKVGLVGLNGVGKSTLLKIIAGQEQPLSGKVHTLNEKVAYLPQDFSLNLKNIDYLGEYIENIISNPPNELWKVKKILGKLNFGHIDEFKHISTLSPGQKMKLYLTKILLSEPSILLLDEPTNHLDILGINEFEKFVKQFPGICILVSHDRKFLNNIITHVFEIDEETLKVYKGNYEDYIKQKRLNIEEREKRFKLQEKKRDKLETLLKNSRNIKDPKKRGKAVEAAKKRIQREISKQEISLYKENSISNFTFDGSVHRKKRILKISNLSFGYSDDTLILEKVNLEMYGGEKIWLLGQNGVGKSTLIKLLVGELKEKSGEILWGQNLRWVYFEQEIENFKTKEKVQDYFYRMTNIEWNKTYKVLDNFLFNENIKNQSINSLSPGQKARLTFSIFVQNQYECLILDEPTNHLDIQTKRNY